MKIIQNTIIRWSVTKTALYYIGSSMILKTCNGEHFLYIYLQLTRGRTFADEHQHLTDLLCLFPVKD